MKPLFLAAAAVIFAIASLAGCETPESPPPPEPTPITPTPPPPPPPEPTPITPTPPPECVVLESIANGSVTESLDVAVVGLSDSLGGRPCAASYREYADNIAHANPPLSPDEVKYYAGQLAWSCRVDVPEGGCTDPMYASPPVDPGGHVVDLLDAAGPHLNPNLPTTIGLGELSTWTVIDDEPIPPGYPQCYSAGNPHRPETDGIPDWGLIPPIDPATAASGTPPTLPSIAVPANPANPYRILAPDGLYGWLVNSPPAKCYFVTITRAGQVRYSPPVGVWPGQGVTDLHHCWERNAWYSNIQAPCP